jgi:hypothetical protein
METPNNDEQNAVTDEIIGRISRIKDLHHLEELASLAVQMTHRRAEEKMEAESMIAEIRARIESAKGETDIERRDETVGQVAKYCVGLLEAAKQRRRPGDVVDPPAQKAKIESPRLHGSDTTPARDMAHPRSKPRGGWLTGALSGMIAAVIAAASIGIVTYPQWRDSPFAKHGDRPSAVYLATMIMNATIDPAKGSDRRSGPFDLHVFTRPDNSVVVLAESVPRRLCLPTALALSAKGTVIINDVTPLRPVKPAFAALCGRAPGEISLAWSAFPAKDAH